MRRRDLRQRLAGAEIPAEHEARARSWDVVRTAFAEREPAPADAHPLRAVVAVIAAGAILAAAFSPPGRAVFGSLRDAIGREQRVPGARPALFSIPSSGRLLVTSNRGAWVVGPDGSKRLLGRYAEATWSPSGRFVGAARQNELVALEPATGELRWSLARPSVRFPRWSGTTTDTRIAYLSRRELRVVGGDGRGDRVIDARVSPVAPAWRPGFLFLLTYVDGGGVLRAVDARTGERLAATRTGPVDDLVWSPDGHFLAARTRRTARVYIPDGRRFRLLRTLPGIDAVTFDAAERVTTASYHPGRDRSRVAVAGRTIFTAAGRLDGLTWSPDGRWLLVAWPAADQWIFVRAGGRRIEAVSRISPQFRATRFPDVSGWCCG